MATIDMVATETYAIPNETSLEDAAQSFQTLELVVIEVETGDGEGTGFTYTIGEGGESIERFVDATLRPILEDGSAAPRAAYERMRSGTTFVGREGISELAIAAVDIALWDALGRRLELPLYELLGGERRPVAAYETDGG